MPNIKITEKDITTPAAAVSGQDVVFVPGFVNAIYSDSTEYVDAYTPMLCDSVAQFETWFGAIPASFAEPQAYANFAPNATPGSTTTAPNMFRAGDMEPGYIYAKELLNAGVSVVYVRLNERPIKKDDGTYYFESAPSVFYATKAEADKTQIKLSHMYDVLSGAADYDLWGDLKDLGEFAEIKYLTSGGYPTFEYKAPTNVKLDVVGNVTVSSWSAAKLKSIFGEIKTTVATFTYGAEVIVLGADEDFPTREEDINENAIYVKGDVKKKYDKVAHTWGNAPEIEWTLTKSGETESIKVSTLSLINDYEIAVDTEATISYGSQLIVTVSVSTSSTIVNKMIDCASNRGDCVALIDHTNNPYRTLNPSKNQSVYWSISNTDSPYKVSVGGSFATMFTPWCEYSYASDFMNSKNKYDYIPEAMPASFGYLMALAKSIQSNVNWLAIAGAARGVVGISKPVLAGNLRLSNTIADAYQPETGIAINPITNVKPYGYIIWGNRTLAPNPDGLVATSFLNTRNMISDIKKAAYKAAKKCMFEQNSDILWVNYKARLTPMLDKMVTGNGLAGYKLIKETAEKKAQLKCTIRLYPIYAVESFDITVILADDEVTVS